MKNHLRLILIPYLVMTLFSSMSNLHAQYPTIYACVLATKNYVVGAKNPPSGLFVSQDIGKSWQHLGWKNIRCFGFAMDPSHVGKTFYLASGNGVLRTMDAGSHWKILTNWHETEIQQVLVNPKTPRKLIAATPYGIFLSEDGGRSWKASNTGLASLDNQFVSALVMDRSNPEHLLLGSESGLFESLNGGKTWESRGFAGIPVLDLRQDSFNTSVFYAGTEDRGVYRSADKGLKWIRSRGKIENKTVYVVAVDPNRKGVLYAGTFANGVYKSVDGGKHWKSAGRGLEKKTIHGLAVYSKNSEIIFAGTAGSGIYKSNNGGKSWQFSGLPRAEVWDVQIW